MSELDSGGRAKGGAADPSRQTDGSARKPGQARSRGNPPRPPLSLEQIAALFDATLGHAKRTLDASELLLANHYLPQAYSLGHIAVEELSKVRLLFAMWLMLATGWGEPDWPNLWKAWSDHGAKNRLLIFARVEEELRSELPPNQEDRGDHGESSPSPELIATQLNQTASFIRTLGVLARAAFPLARNFSSPQWRAHPGLAVSALPQRILGRVGPAPGDGAAGHPRGHPHQPARLERDPGRTVKPGHPAHPAESPSPLRKTEAVADVDGQVARAMGMEVAVDVAA